MKDLFEAIKTGNEELVRSLIEGGIDVNKMDDKHQMSPLLYLVDNFYDNVWNKDKEIRDQRSQCQIKILEMLIHAGADINATSHEGHNALHLIFETVHSYDIKFVKVLLKHGCDVNATYYRPCRTLEGISTTILHLALNPFLCEFDNLDGNAETIKLLLNYGADANIKDSFGWNAIESYLLSHASNYYYYSLRHRGIDPNIVKLFSLDNIGMSPLHRSSIFDKYDDFCELASKPGVDINAVDKLGNTPLSYAVVLKHNDLLLDTLSSEMLAEDENSKIKLLLSLGADMRRRYNSYNNDKTYRITDLPPGCEYRMVYDILVQGVLIQSVSSGPSRITDDGPEYELMNNLKIKFCKGTAIYDEFYPEFMEMKECLLIDNISIFDLLVANSTLSEMYAKNKQLVSALETSLSERMFPIYEEWLFYTNFGLALERRKLLEPAAVELCSILEFADPTDVFYEKTLSYLSNRDLKLLLGLKGINTKYLIMRESLLGCSSEDSSF